MICFLVWIFKLIENVILCLHRFLIQTRFSWLFIFCTKKQREELTCKAYRKHPVSLGPSDTLFDWEDNLVQALKPSASVLICGAGKGRELDALTKRGFKCVGFDLSFKTDKVLCASFDQFIQMHLKNYATFDVIWFGWGSFSHLLDDHEVNKILDAFLEHSPNACLVLSVFPSVCMGQFDRMVRTFWFKFFLRKQLPLDVHYFNHCGFVRSYQSDWFDAVLNENQLKPLIFNAKPYPHALLHKQN